MIRIGLVTPFVQTKGYEPKTGRQMPHKKFACNARPAVQSFRKIIPPHARSSSVLLQSTTVGLKSSIIIA